MRPGFCRGKFEIGQGRHASYCARVGCGAKPHIKIRQLTQEYPSYLTGQFKYTFYAGLMYHGKTVIYWGYFRKRAPDGHGLSQ